MPPYLPIIFFPANNDGGNNDDRVNIIPFSRMVGGKIKCSILKVFAVCRKCLDTGWDVHLCGVSANFRGADCLLLRGRVA